MAANFTPAPLNNRAPFPDTTFPPTDLFLQNSTQCQLPHYCHHPPQHAEAAVVPAASAASADTGQGKRPRGRHPKYCALSANSLNLACILASHVPRCCSPCWPSVRRLWSPFLRTMLASSSVSLAPMVRRWLGDGEGGREIPLQRGFPRAGPLFGPGRPPFSLP